MPVLVVIVKWHISLFLCLVFSCWRLPCAWFWRPDLQASGKRWTLYARAIPTHSWPCQSAAIGSCKRCSWGGTYLHHAGGRPQVHTILLCIFLIYLFKKIKSVSCMMVFVLVCSYGSLPMENDSLYLVAYSTILYSFVLLALARSNVVTLWLSWSPFSHFASKRSRFFLMSREAVCISS